MNKSKIGIVFICMLLAAVIVSEKAYGKEFDGSTTPWFGADIFSPREGFTSYENLPCINEKDYQEIIQYIGINENGLEGELCGDGSNREKFGKLLRYMKSLAVKLPKDWSGGADEALTNPLKYLKKMTRTTFGFDLHHHGAAIAYNMFGSIYLCARFFVLDPLDALGVLIHEARHSDTGAARHFECTAGDRARQRGACDKWFSVGEAAGAYAYAVSWYYGLAKFGRKSQVSEEDRDFLRSLANSLLARRFNAVPDMLGLPFELIYVLDSSSQLSYIHPILKSTFIVHTHGRLDGSGVKRIEFNREKNQLYLYTKNGNVFYNESLRSPFELFDTNVVPADSFVKDITRLTSNNDSTTYYITQDGQLRNRMFDTNRQFYAWERSKFQTDQYELSSLIHASGKERYALAATGELLQFKQNKDAVDGESNLFLSDFQAPADAGWKHITGGILYTDLIGVDNDGLLYAQNEDAVELIDDEGPINKYFEGTNFSVTSRSHQGIVYVKRYGEEREAEFAKGDLSGYASDYSFTYWKDFAVIRNFRAADRFYNEVLVSEKFVKACNLKKYEMDPWTGKGMGLSRDNELVFEGPEHRPCQKYDFHGVVEITDYRFVGTSVNDPGTFSQVALEVETEGRWRKLYPYDYKNSPE